MPHQKVLKPIILEECSLKKPPLPSLPTPEILYPLDIPDIAVETELDFLLLEIPPRYVPMMPNGLGYIDNLLKSSGIRKQILDLSILLYHRYHCSRLLDKKIHIRPSGTPMPVDPWDKTMRAEWHGDDFLAFFKPDLREALDKIEQARPRILGVSLNSFNRKIAGWFLGEIRRRLPKTLVMVGGYDCVYPQVGPRLFSDFDYMVVGEAENSLIPLLRSLLAGERPGDVPGALSKFDSPGRVFSPAPLPDSLDLYDFPRYEWISHSIYQTFDRKHLVPITGSRGCNWGRCNFCAECFAFRKRSPKSVADEIAHWTALGFHAFHFNESDVNGDPANLHSICSEIIKRDLAVTMVGQIRIDKHNTPEYFQHLAKAGFTHLRFGVDGLSTHALALQNKGYPIELVHSNLRACRAAGIHTTVYIVIGVPGETEADIEESIANIALLKDDIDCVESLTTLILAVGSRYLSDPEKHNIRFRGDKDSILAEHPYLIPSDLWYSEAPYIDQTVRLERLDRIVLALDVAGIFISDFGKGRITELKQGDQAWYPQKRS